MLFVRKSWSWKRKHLVFIKLFDYFFLNTQCHPGHCCVKRCYSMLSNIIGYSLSTFIQKYALLNVSTVYKCCSTNYHHKHQQKLHTSHGYGPQSAYLSEITFVRIFYFLFTKLNTFDIENIWWFENILT